MISSCAPNCRSYPNRAYGIVNSPCLLILLEQNLKGYLSGNIANLFSYDISFVHDEISEKLRCGQKFDLE